MQSLAGRTRTMNDPRTMTIDRRWFVAALVLTCIAPAALAQDVADGAAGVASAPVRNATVTLGAVTGLSPFFATGAEARAQLRVHSYVSITGSFGVDGRVVAAGTFDERSVVRAGWQGGVRVWPQRRALEGWSLGLAYGRAVHQAVDDPLQVPFEDDESATLSRLTIDVGHQWLLRRSRRLVAFANGAVSRNGRVARPSRLAVPRVDALVSVGIGLAF